MISTQCRFALEVTPEFYYGPLQKSAQEIVKLKGAIRDRITLSDLADRIGCDPRTLQRYLKEGRLQAQLRDRGVILQEVGDPKTVPGVIIDPPRSTLLSALARHPLSQRIVAAHDIIQVGVETAIPRARMARALLGIKRPPERMVTISEDGVVGLMRSRFAQMPVQHSP